MNRLFKFQGYIRGMVALALSEGADWFIPVSHTNYAIADAAVKAELARMAKVDSSKMVRCLTFDDPEVTSQLDDKLSFLKWAEELGLGVPGFKKVTNVREVEYLAR